MPLKIAVITEENTQPLWVMRCLESIYSIDKVEIVLHLIAEKPDSSTPFSWKDLPLRIFKKHLFFKLFYKFHSKEIKKTSDEISKFGFRSSHTKVLKEGKYSYKFSKTIIDEIQDLNLDIILLFGVGIIKGDILKSSKYGVWSHHHGDERAYRGRPACFWEYFYGEKLTGGILQKLSPVLDGGVVLERFFIRNEGLNYVERLNEIQLAGSRAAEKAVKKILNGIHLEDNSDVDRNLGPIYRMPNNLVMILFFFKSCIQKVKYLLSSWFMSDYWCVGVGKIDSNTNALGLNFDSIVWNYYPSDDGFIADPYLFDIGKGIQVLLEDYSYKTRRGKIGKYNLTKKNQLVRCNTFLDNYQHLSFPTTFECGEEHYFICESQTEGMLKAYLIKDDKIDKKRSIVLLKEKVADPFIIEHKSQLWLFGSDENHRMSIWYSSNKNIDFKRTYYSPFLPNPLNCRSAGRPVTIHGKLLRFAQDFSGEYGDKIHVYQIETLSEKEYIENYKFTIEADSNWKFKKGIHTLNILGDRFVIDAKTSRLISFEIFKKKIFRLINY